MFEYFINCALTLALIVICPALVWAITQKIMFTLLVLNKDEEVDEMNEKYKKYEKMFSYLIDYNP